MSTNIATTSAAMASAGKTALTWAAAAAGRVLRMLTTTSLGRFSALAVLIAAALWFGARDGVLSTLGWGAVPAFCWLAFSLLLLTRGVGLLAARWRTVVALFGLAAAAVGGLGAVGPPSDAFGPSMGGLAGAAIARYPLTWDAGGSTVPQLILGAVRVAAVAALSAAFIWPANALVATRAAAAATGPAGRKVAAGA